MYFGKATLFEKKIYELLTLWSLLSVLFYQTSWSDFPHKFSIKRPGLFQVLSALVIENQGNLKIFERVSIKRPVLTHFQILEALNNQVL